MKRILFITGMAIASLLYSCGKSSVSPNTDNGDNGTGDNPVDVKPTVTIKWTPTDGGNCNFDTNGILMSTGVSKAGTTQGMETDTGGTVQLSLLRDTALKMTQIKGAWEATAKNKTDTSKEAILSGLVTDSEGNITLYHAYIGGTLDYISKNLPANMTTADFAKALNSNNQKITTFNP